ncbi:FAD-binding protein [Rhodobacterales bacterium HKCCE2091]|nr:FAD-binding protein [Rhodobacterales bacterium HKCCE2091]
MTYDKLKSRVRGTVITRFDPDHAAACDALVWNGRKPPRTAQVIVRAADAADVQAAVLYAAEHDLGVSARTGGHQFTGIAVRAQMVIDLGALDSLRIDAAARVAEIGPAVTNARLIAALDRHGLAFPVGHCGSVPMGGYLLGGGIGWNGAEWGIACHSVLSVDVVLADGRLVTATETDHADLFWAARGAGPEFFGIVTRYRVRLQEAPRALTSVIRVYPAAAAEAVADWAERAVARAPANVEFTAKIEQSPDGPTIAAIATVFAASDAEAAATCAAFTRDAPEGALAVIGPMPTPFEALYEGTASSTPKGSRYAVDCYWSDRALGTALSRMVAGFAATPSGRSFGLVVLRSNAGPVPPISAFSQVGRVFGAVYAVWEDEEEDAANLSWLRRLSANAAGYVTGAYVGEADLENPGARPATLSPEVTARLAELRARHDPEGRFRRQPLVARQQAA